MDDMISRQMAIDAIRNIRATTGTHDDEVLLIDKAEAQTELMLLPSARPEIIRCKDCKWHRGQYHCLNTDTYGYGLDDFCSLAERGNAE